MKIIFYLIIILLISIIKNNNVLRIPFKTMPYKTLSTFNISSYMPALIHNDIYITFQIGSPPQEINSFLKFEEFPFFISGKDISSSHYNESKSSTYKSEKYPHAFLEGKDKIKWGYVSNDTFNIIKNNNKEKLGEINFILATESRTDSLSNIGLMIPNSYNSIPDISFIYQLKKQKIITEYNFMVNYTDCKKGEGEFIVGTCPHSFEKNKYDKNYYRTSYAIEKPNFMMYGLNFDEIIFELNDKKDLILGPKQAKFLSDFGLIVGSIDYYDLISKNFFDKKIKDNICFKDKIKANIEWREGETDFEFFYCDKSLLKEDELKNIGNIKFFHKEMNYTFEFNYNELFDEKNELYIFKIIFNPKNNFYWIFGKLWLAKYLMIFNQDSKTIGHYYYVGNIIKEKNGKDKINWVLLGIIGILVLFIIIFGSWMIYHYKKEIKKKRINEIIDDYDYIQENNDKQNNLINKNLGLNE